jgi:transcriptional regulator, XRE family
MWNRVRSLRRDRRWTQAELGEALGVSRQTIIAIENGKYDPSLRLAFAIASVFELRVDEVFNPDGGDAPGAAEG